MRTRPLEPEEQQFLLKAFGTPKTPRPWWDFFCLSALISVPLFLLFFTVSVLAEKRSPREAFFRGIPVLLLGSGFLLIQKVMRRRYPDPDPFAQVREEAQAGICQIREFRIRRAWPLIDEGNDSEPDYLAETEAGKYIAVSRGSLKSPLPFRRKLEVHELPKSRVTVRVTFSGDEVPLDSTAIRTDNVWRNDDLPWERQIAAKRLPEEARKIILAGAAPDRTGENP